MRAGRMGQEMGGVLPRVPIYHKVYLHCWVSRSGRSGSGPLCEKDGTTFGLKKKKITIFNHKVTHSRVNMTLVGVGESIPETRFTCKPPPGLVRGMHESISLY